MQIAEVAQDFAATPPPSMKAMQAVLVFLWRNADEAFLAMVAVHIRATKLAGLRAVINVED